MYLWMRIPPFMAVSSEADMSSYMLQDNMMWSVQGGWFGPLSEGDEGGVAGETWTFQPAPDWGTLPGLVTFN